MGSQRTMIPVQLGGLNLEFPGPTPGGSIEGVMGSSVVTRSCRALGAEKLPITRVVPSLVSISPPNKGVGHSGTTRNWWENIWPSQQQRSVRVNLLVVAFPVAPKMVQVWEKALE